MKEADRLRLYDAYVLLRRAHRELKEIMRDQASSREYEMAKESWLKDLYNVISGDRNTGDMEGLAGYLRGEGIIDAAGCYIDGEDKVCEECGSIVSEDDEECPHCGESIN